MLSVLLRTSELQWSDGARTLSQDEALPHLLALAEKSSHRSESRRHLIVDVLPARSQVLQYWAVSVKRSFAPFDVFRMRWETVLRSSRFGSWPLRLLGQQIDLTSLNN